MVFEKQLERAQSVADVFVLVKRSVSEYVGRDQAGLLIGLSDLGTYGHAFLGAFYSMDANTIVINKRPLQSLNQVHPEWHNAYLFHVLLHEYLKSLNIFDEEEVVMLVYEITKRNLGENHAATQMALDIDRFIPHLNFSNFEPPKDLNIEFLHGIDRDNTNYIM